MTTSRRDPNDGQRGAPAEACGLVTFVSLCLAGQRSPQAGVEDDDSGPLKERKTWNSPHDFTFSVYLPFSDFWLDFSICIIGTVSKGKNYLTWPGLG